MEFVEPKVFLIGETQIHHPEMRAYLEEIGAGDWKSFEETGKRILSDSEIMTEGVEK